MAGCYNRLQGSYGKIRCSHKYNSHPKSSPSLTVVTLPLPDPPY
jgi:hypothetical protein